MGPRVRGDDERVVCSIIVIASGAKQSIARHRQIEDGLLRRFASRNDDAVVPAKAGTHTPRPRGLARWLTLLLQETLVVMGPRVRGDDERVVCSIIVIASGAKQSIARHRQIEDGLLRRFASRNDDAVVPAKAGTHTPRPRGLARCLTAFCSKKQLWCRDERVALTRGSLLPCAIAH